MKKPPLILLRAETKANEYRTPLAPQEVTRLIKQGFSVIVESSPQRCFCDADYRTAGAQITYAGSWVGNTLLQEKNSWVLGLKELPEADFDLPQQHIYFAHIFKNQKGASKILQRFTRANGSILDLEYLMDSKGVRLAAFGYWAGYVGASLALWQWLKKRQGKNLQNLKPLNKKQLHQNINELIVKSKEKLPLCLIIGAKGKCGQGAQEALQNFSLISTLWDQKETEKLNRQEILQHHILLNCAFVNQKIEPFLTKEDLAKNLQLEVVCDVSCDFGSCYHPIPIYPRLTDWETPTINIDSKKKLSVIAIDNLPSLLPAEASKSFSKMLTPLLIKLPENSEEWQRSYFYFLKSSQEL